MVETRYGIVAGGSQYVAWKALHYFNLYRITLAGLFVTLASTGRLLPPLGHFDLPVFFFTSVVYLVIGLISATLIVQRRPGYKLQVITQAVVDIIAITLLMYASGGVVSGVGMLLAVSIAGVALLTAGRTGILFAAGASLAVLVEEAYAWAYLVFPTANYTHAGLLGATFFATAWLGHVLSRRVRETEALAEQRGIDIENLSRLNEHIVERMQSGVAVLDGRDQVLLLNASANRLLGVSGEAEGQRMGGLVPELADTIRLWRSNPEHTPILVQPTGSDVEVLVALTALDESGGVLLFLEDASVMRQRAQQLKLASLGRLAASIAHEVRNPLGAISHAGQLLAEVGTLGEDGKRLTEIIGSQSKRVNAIIENVLSISRREQSEPEAIVLHDWLREFVSEFSESAGLSDGEIVLEITNDQLVARMDSGQMHQVLWNLCDNAMRYGQGTPLIELRADLGEELQRPYLDVINRGAAIAEQTAEQLFEPFFTTAPSGTGLGLYIARELCESNQATLQLMETNESLTRFRIGFAHPDRSQINFS